MRFGTGFNQERGRRLTKKPHNWRWREVAQMFLGDLPDPRTCRTFEQRLQERRNIAKRKIAKVFRRRRADRKAA